MIDGLFEIRGKVILITGGAQGLGRMIAQAMVEAGARTYITSRRAELVEQAAQEMSLAGQCIGLAADISSPEAAVALADELKRREQRVHVIINNAGKTWGAPLESFPDKAWPSVMAVNVQAPFTLVRELLPLLSTAGTADDPARVINIGSVAGRQVEPISAYSYAASKAAIQHLSRVLAADLARHHITVNTVVPGYFPTGMTAHIREDGSQREEINRRVPLGRMGRSEDIAGMCLFLASRASAYITGAELVVDGGMTGCH